VPSWQFAKSCAPCLTKTVEVEILQPQDLALNILTRLV
jgi:hypothetical protein